MTEAYARNTDPKTSQIAADKISATDLEMVVLIGIKMHGPITAHRLSEKLGASLVSISPRMKPLEQKKLIERAGVTTEAGSNRPRTLWRAT